VPCGFFGGEYEANFLYTSCICFSHVGRSISGGGVDALVPVEASAKRLNDSFARSGIVAKSGDDGVLGGLGLVKAETK
jgi:hypothetical protein